MGSLPSHFILCSTSIALLLSLLLLLYKTLIKAGNRRHAGLRLPPSPFAVPVIGHLHLLPPIPHQSLHSLSLRLGPIFRVRLGRIPCVVVSSPATAREIFKTQETSFLDRPLSQTLSYLTYNSDFAFAPYGPYWRFMRRVCMHELLCPKTLDQLSPVRHQEMCKFVEGLHTKSTQGASVDMSQELIKLTNNAISRVAVGRRCSESESGAEEARRIIKDGAELAGAFNLGDYIGGVFKYLDVQGINKRMRDVRERYDAMMEGFIKEKEEKRIQEKISCSGENRTKDLLDMMLDIAEDETTEIKLTREHIKAFLLDVIQGGTDTSAVAIEWGLAKLINHPAVLQKAQAEIDAIVGNSRIVRESDTPNLPYLQCIVKETLRLHPTGPLIARQSTRDCEVAGYHIPSKTQVLVNTWSIGRDPDHWDEPLEFRPERFMDSQVDVKGHHFQLVPFGSGRRGCPGLPLALHTVHVALAAMVQCFHWRTDEGIVDMGEGVGFTLPKAKPLVCTPVARLNPMPLA